MGYYDRLTLRKKMWTILQKFWGTVAEGSLELELEFTLNNNIAIRIESRAYIPVFFGSSLCNGVKPLTLNRRRKFGHETS